MSAQSLEEDAKQHVANTSGENEGRILSPSQREALQNVREKLPESNQRKPRKAQTADKTPCR
jgi:conjugal transfer mating pair stabilization protein TraG